jgi:hypothetical protein
VDGDRILRVFVYAPIIRIKYYFGWKLAEMSFLSCGMSFMLVKEKQQEETGDGKVVEVEQQVVRWSRFSNVNAILCEVRTIQTFFVLDCSSKFTFLFVRLAALLFVFFLWFKVSCVFCCGLADRPLLVPRERA